MADEEFSATYAATY
jgi:RNA polymerase sigma-70 factor, ECF subfamily